MTRRVNSGRVAGFALLATCVLTACETKRTEIFDSYGPPAFDFAVATGTSKLPTGRADRQIVRTLVQNIELDYSGAALATTVLTRPSGNTQDTLAVDSAVSVVARSLRALGGGRVYEVWSMAPDGTSSPVYGRVVEYKSVYSGNLDPITGDSVFLVDSTEVAASGAGTYVGSDEFRVDSVAFHVIPSDPTNTVNPFSNTQANAIFVSIESAAATTPSNARFLWSRAALVTGGTVANVTVTADTVYLSTNPPFPADAATPDTIQVTRRARSTLNGSGALTFGNFGGLDVVNAASPNDYVFGARGTGFGGARGPEMSVDVAELARPPIGFFYRGYVVDAVGNEVMIDTLRSAWSEDPSVSRVSLYDADINDLLPNIVEHDVRAAQIRNCAMVSAVNNCQNGMALPVTDTFKGFVSFVLKIEPKGSVSSAPTKSITHAGDLPKEVQ